VTTVQSSQLTFTTPAYFAAHWLGCDPRDRQPRLVQCFGPAVRDDHAVGQGAVLGLDPVTLGNPPPLTSVSAVLEGECLVLYSQGLEVLRSDPLPSSFATVLQRRAEVLLVWVDLPLRDPRTELSLIGLQHVWTGIAQVDRAEDSVFDPVPEGSAPTIVPPLPGGWVQ